MQLAVWCAIWILLFQTATMAPSNANCAPLVLVEQGLLRGTCNTTLQGDIYYAFKGIPFGKPPVGRLRFQAPQPAEPWDGILDATKNSNICPQMFSEDTIKYKGDEDCLRLYVYSHPLSRYNKSLPVLVYIHGGAALKGHALYVKPQRLMSIQALPTVIVAIQYRLCSLGLLSTGDDASPGNYAALDVILALQWVKKNIRQFGGDPNKVTVAGDSAGGISAFMLLVSPAAAGLFRAIATFSGTIDIDITMQYEPLYIAKQLGASLGCKSDNTTVLVECLRGKTAMELTLAFHTLPLQTGEVFPFGFVVEKAGTAQFLGESPQQMLSEGRFHKVPVMLGSTKDETATLFLAKYADFIKYTPMIPVLREIIIFNVFIPFLVHVFLKYATNLHALSYAIKREYQANYNFLDKKQLQQFIIDMSTDASFRVGVDKAARWLTKHNVKTYLYSFESHADFDTTNFGDKEVGHIDNVWYYFLEDLTPKDTAMSDILLSHLLNFVHYLDPTPGDVVPKWTPTVSERKLQYMRYRDDEVAMKQGYFTEKTDFWKTQVPKIISAKRFNGSVVKGLTWL